MNSTFQQKHDYTQNRDELIEVVKKHMPEYPWRMMNSGKAVRAQPSAWPR